MAMLFMGVVCCIDTNGKRKEERRLCAEGGDE